MLQSRVASTGAAHEEPCTVAGGGRWKTKTDSPSMEVLLERAVICEIVFCLRQSLIQHTPSPLRKGLPSATLPFGSSGKSPVCFSVPLLIQSPWFQFAPATPT